MKLKNIAVVLFVSAISAHTNGQEQTDSTPAITVQENGSQLPMTGLDAFFTGQVRVVPVFQPKGNARAGGANVTFEPGARTNWHTHPLGQTLVINSGQGWVMQWNGERHEVEPGDVIHIPANVKHWHGATASTHMSHLAIQEAKDGEVVNWMEAVTDNQYLLQGATGQQAKQQ